jgi:hypothetical protein
MWRMLHGLALLVRADPDREKTDLLYVLLHTLRLLLPCRMCRDNMGRHMTKIPIPARRHGEAETAEAVRVWLHEMHNAVNVLRGKLAVSYHAGMHEELGSLMRTNRGLLVRRVVDACNHATGHVGECVRERRKFADVECNEIEAAWSLYRASVPRLLALVRA